ncbi:WYL domain-containing protein [Burkholderia pseudomultivorans]|uniref:WYL domain-containing protein n=1 Tax=Burkholderia pseudomultivorans TaxID=1207504 RepID=UPI0009BE4B53|nr:WYL domain-containing protein [Burkholderia pseudomultivorans]
MNEDTDDFTPASPARGNPRWGQERRLAFIDFRLRWDGRINRSDLTDFFGISVPQASLDLSRYMELAPGNLLYDRRARVYLAQEGFQPIYADTQPGRYLNELLASTQGVIEREASFIGWQPVAAGIPHPGREVEPATLAALLKAMREASGLKIVYQSMSKPEPGERTISPHAFAHDGFRWHVRAFCHARHAFRDFVLGRILETREFEPSQAIAAQDMAWNTVLSLLIAPNPGLSLGGQRAIELDYGMKDGQVELKCRQALLFYSLKRLGLMHQSESRPEVQQIVLKNRAEIEPYLAALTESN